MQAISDALNRLNEEASWFARAHELKLLVVRVSGDLRGPALKMLPGYECHADNFSPWVLLPDGYTKSDNGWQLRANRLAKDWEARREAFAKAGTQMPSADAVSAASPARPLSGAFSPGLAAFCLKTAAVVRALRDPLRGLVLILAPPVVEDSRALERDIELLIGVPALGPCRFVLVLDEDIPEPRDLKKAVGQAGLVCACMPDPGQMAKDLKALVGGDAGEAAPVLPGARPRGVKPPPRVDDPPEIPKAERDKILREAGVNPAYLDEAPRLRQLVLGAAVAMKEGRGPDAVRQQREARDLFARLEMHEAKVISQIALASYLSGLSASDLAVKELEDAARYAAEHGQPKVQSQAHLALGLLHALAKRLAPAAQQYQAAARAAETAGVALLAIEGWRMAGQIALQAFHEEKAIEYFGEAIRVAQGAEPNEVKSSSGPEAARRLAALYAQRGQRVQADSLYGQADLMEQGEIGKAAKPDGGGKTEAGSVARGGA